MIAFARAAVLIELGAPHTRIARLAGAQPTTKSSEKLTRAFPLSEGANEKLLSGFVLLRQKC